MLLQPAKRIPSRMTQNKNKRSAEANEKEIKKKSVLLTLQLNIESLWNKNSLTKTIRASIHSANQLCANISLYFEFFSSLFFFILRSVLKTNGKERKLEFLR